MSLGFRGLDSFRLFLLHPTFRVKKQCWIGRVHGLRPPRIARVSVALSAYEAYTLRPEP